MSKKKKQKKEPKQKNNAVELVPQHSTPGSRQSVSAPRMSYGSHGASQTLNSMVGWIIDPGNAEDNIDLYSSLSFMFLNFSFVIFPAFISKETAIVNINIVCITLLFVFG